MKAYYSKSGVKQNGKNRKGYSAAKIDPLMERYNVQSEGKSLSGHFSPAEAVELLESAANRGRSVSEIIARSAVLGLPMLKEQLPQITCHQRGRPGQVHRVHTITPPLAKLMKKWKVQERGKTLTGHFRPEEAIDLLETARTRNMSMGRILRMAVRLGLPEIKRRIPLIV